MDLVPVFILLAFALVVGLIFFFLFGLPRLLRKRKGLQWSDWAQENGWTYEAERPDLVAMFVTAHNAHVNRVQHVLSRPHRGRWVFTYEHLEGVPAQAQAVSGTGQCQRVVAVSLPVAVPKTDIGGGHSITQLVELLHAPVIETGDRRFDSLYRVRSQDEGFARALLTPQVMERLVARHAQSRPPVRLTGHYIAAAEDGALDPENALRAADKLIDLVETFPDRVWAGHPQ